MICENCVISLFSMTGLRAKFAQPCKKRIRATYDRPDEDLAWDRKSDDTVSTTAEVNGRCASHEVIQVHKSQTGNWLLLV